MPEVANGTYRATAESADLSFTATGKEMITVRFRLETGASLWWRGFFTDKTTERTFESLRACGWTGNDISSVAFPPDNSVEVVVENEEYQGKVHPKIQWVNAIRGASIQNAMDPLQAKSFAARMKGALVAFDQKNKAAAPPTETKAPAAAPNGDIPF
jgi:hypothetical protein